MSRQSLFLARDDHFLARVSLFFSCEEESITRISLFFSREEEIGAGGEVRMARLLFAIGLLPRSGASAGER